MLYLKEIRSSGIITHTMFCIMNYDTFAYICMFDLKKKNPLYFCDSHYVAIIFKYQ